MVLWHEGVFYIGTYGKGIVNMRNLYGKIGHLTGVAFEQMLDLERPVLAWFNEDMAEQVWSGVDRAIVAGMASMR